jgi:hypothetical protein
MFKSVAGFIVGVIVVGLTGSMRMPYLRLTERIHPFSRADSHASGVAHWR